MARLPLPPWLRPIAWQAVLSLAMRIAHEGRQRWNRLTPHEHRRVKDAVTRSRGRIDRLSESERRELRRIVWKALGPT
jgi:hypothetical protein